MEVLVIYYKKILRELEDHITDPLSDAIEYTDARLTYPLYIPRHYNFGPKSISLVSQLLCTMFSIYNLVY